MDISNVDIALRLLQVVSLSLPAVVLYMGVLTEIHMVARRVTGIKLETKEDEDWSDADVYTHKPDRYTAQLTEAAGELDFFFAILSMVGLLIAGLLFGFYITVEALVVYQLALIILALSYILLAVSCGFLIRIGYLNLRSDD